MAELSDDQRIRILLELQAGQLDKEAKRATRAIEAIERRTDSTARATQKYERDLRNLDRSLAAGTITQDRYQKVLNSVEREYRTATQAAEVFDAATMRASTGTGRLAGAAQNASYQVGDFAVQIASGGSAVTALAQQLPQLLGGFGLLGAALGAIVAIGGAAYKVFADTADGAEELKEVDLSGLQSSMEEIASLESRLAELHAARARAQSSASDDIIGGLERELAARKVLFEFERLQAEQQVKALDAKIAQMQAELEVAVRVPTGMSPRDAADTEFVRSPQASEDLAAVQANIAAQAELTDNLRLANAERDLTVLSLDRITDAMDGQIDAAQSSTQAATEQATAVERIAGAMDAAYQVYGQTRAESDIALAIAQDMLKTLEDQALAGMRMADATDKVAEAARQRAEAEREVFEETLAALQVSESMKEELRGAFIMAQNIAAENMAGNIGAAADEAARLAGNLARAIAMSPITADMRDEDTVMSQPVTPDAAMREQQRKAVENFNRLTAPAKGGGGGGRKRSGGGGGGKSDAQRQLEEYERDAERVYSSTRTAAESYAIEMERLNRLHLSGALDLDTYNRAVEKLDSGLRETELDRMRKQFDGIAESIAGAIVQSDSLRDSFGNMFAQMAQDYIKNGISDILMSLGGSGGIFGGLFGGKVSGGSATNAAAGSGGLYANGAAFAGGRVIPFAAGGVVTGPTMFPMAGGRAGLMGEAGAEAIMPLARGPTGKLGVKASGGTSKVQVEVIGGNLTLTDGGAVMAQFSVGMAQNNAQRDQAFVGKVNSTRANTHRRLR